MKLVIASNNANKVREIKSILGDCFDDIRSLKELNIDIEVEETGSTFAENALLKARAIVGLTDRCVLADDSGLCVKSLDGAPGVYSARYAGEEHDDSKNNALLLRNLADKTDRTAYFTTVMALIFPDGKEILAEGRTDGYILDAPDGDNGFGYDPIFYSSDLQKSFGKATAEEKNAVSHRARALEELKTVLLRSTQ